MSVYDEPETLRLLGLNKRREERDPNEEFLRELENRDMERAADRIEELSAGWVDWRGFPLPGFESPRFLSERDREYKSWYRGSSPDAERARRARGDR
jgi:hypothetical protein